MEATKADSTDRPCFCSLPRESGRLLYLSGPRYTVSLEFTAGRWLAVELDEFGGFRRRLFDGRQN